MTNGGDTNKNCHVDYKVYVYDLPSTLLQRGEEARQNHQYHICRKCIFEQFALEYILFDYFTQFCGRTNQPEEADFFYLPIIRDLDYRIALTGKGDRKPSPIDQTLLDVLEKDDFHRWNEVFNVTDIYWRLVFYPTMSLCYSVYVLTLTLIVLIRCDHWGGQEEERS